MSKKSERLWRGFAVLAACIYLISIFAPWHAASYLHESWLRALIEANGASGSVLGISSLVLCYLTLVFALLGPRRSALSLERQRTVLASSLVLLTTFFFLSKFWRLPGWNESARWIGYGAWTALGSSLALLFAVALLDAGGLGRLLDRLPVWARLDQLQIADDAPRKPVISYAERSRRRWTTTLTLALVVYLLSLLMTWWSSSSSWTAGVIGPSRTTVSGLAGIGEFCALVGLATVVIARLTRSGQATSLERLRNVLIAALVGLTLVNVFVVRGLAGETFSPYQGRFIHSRPDWGALVGLASVALCLVATLVSNASRRPGLVDRPLSPRPTRRRSREQRGRMSDHLPEKGAP